MRNSSFIALPLRPKQLVIVCGHVGLPAFGREHGISQSHVQVQPVSGWKEFPQSVSSDLTETKTSLALPGHGKL